MQIKLTNETEERVIKYIDENKDELYHQLCELVKIDTVNHRAYGNENQGQAYMEKLCSELGLKTDRFTPESIQGIKENKDYMPGRSADKRENFVAILHGKDNSENVMLAAHMDTERIGDPKLWTVDPLAGVIKDGKIYGRGAGDDKAGIIAAWFVLKTFKTLGVVPKKNLLLGAYCDEEGGGGNGALALGLKYPCTFCANLDSSGIETIASGGGCFRLKLKSVNQDANVASVFEAFEGVQLVVKKLSELDKRPKTKIRLSTAAAGLDGLNEGVVDMAVYTNMTKEQCISELDKICKDLKNEFDKLGLVTDGFELITRFFIYGETKKDSREAQLLQELVEEELGCSVSTEGNCLSDLSLLLAYCSENSLNFGINVGSPDGGGPHQPDEHIHCDEFLSFTKKLALLLLRM